MLLEATRACHRELWKKRRPFDDERSLSFSFTERCKEYDTRKACAGPASELPWVSVPDNRKSL